MNTVTDVIFLQSVGFSVGANGRRENDDLGNAPNKMDSALRKLIGCYLILEAAALIDFMSDVCDTSEDSLLKFNQ